MTKRIEASLVGLAGLTSGMGAASVNIAARFTDDPGDILGFFGGAIGAALAVLGAIAVEHWKEKQRVQRGNDYLAQALVALGAQTITSKTAPGGPTWGAVIAIVQSMEAVKRAYASAVITNALVNSRLAVLFYWIEEWSITFRKLAAVMEGRENEVKDHVDAASDRIIGMVLWVLRSPDDWPGDAPDLIRQFQHAAAPHVVSPVSTA